MSDSNLRFYQEICTAFEGYLVANKPTLQNFDPPFDPSFKFETAFWEMLLNGGKRFRPKLLLAVVCAFVRSPQRIKRAFPIALALEVLHTYSLIHDDLPCMDNSPLRRGHPTLHTTYNETTATLVGDGLNTYAFELIACSKLPSPLKVCLVATLAQCGGVRGMVLGQALDCHFEGQELWRAQLEELHILKTGKLIAASLKMGALISKEFSKTPARLAQTLFDLGLLMGLFFQVRDDIIDATQSPEQSGKSTQADGLKNTYVHLLGLNGAQGYLATLQAQLLERLEILPPALKGYLTHLLESLA
ncbi:polyprenyl synthetase family protein [Helicobacter ailurogastricus]|uniref:(2E,6E)-farnesyl diphosphate synthase n=1 Tax=Helicobacter ailurogastricus TaxID=1578720 RepID=A0A0K2X7K6_9HELI|nr:polyprenyl synthetase family protein [Helicobacter ailurogastricus]CRF40694.1 (2E,6E)-farnesyl diphosphate synthase [Helicobacter ailurogastricus]CRF43087.1 (2E,6E)-farnesyl diphosphate synthase [Helicobacter ailurogastricus]CRF44316.1 (2E,6E)-farnesyl diphosphate synthase [Helicobacter ailurogastricus]